MCIFFVFEQQLLQDAERRAAGPSEELARAQDAIAAAEAARARAEKAAEDARAEAAAEVAKIKEKARESIEGAERRAAAIVEETREAMRRLAQESADTSASVNAEAEALAVEVGILKDELAAETARANKAESELDERAELSCEVAAELTTLRSAVSHAVASITRNPPPVGSAKVMGEALAGAAARSRDTRDRFEGLKAACKKTCDQILGAPRPPVSQVDRLADAAKWFQAESGRRKEAEAELLSVQTSAGRIRDLVLENADGVSSMPQALAMAAERIEDRIEAAAATGARWGARMALTTAVSHFPEVKPDLPVIGDGFNPQLTRGATGLLWAEVSDAAERIASRIPGRMARHDAVAFPHEEDPIEEEATEEDPAEEDQ